eukprot:TRINITY_DN1275_c0_g1_i1.p1 TRINITY_DN1275_c0_g1~~TRINITY_DN1275_c0_g1_i1.p1  ORF type:complete len:305 (-),score=114.71 TRINITY_DN1275_c0_g1_i1:384-1298(-)
MAKLVRRIEGTWNTKTRVNNYKLVLKELEMQFAEADHPFNCIQVEFTNYVLATYSNISIDTVQEMKDSLLNEVRDIIKILCYVLIKFYQLDLQCDERNVSLFLIPVTDLVASSGVYACVMKALVMEQEKGLEEFGKQLAAFKGLELEKLKLGKYFAFNKEFRATFPLKGDVKPDEEVILSKPIQALKKFESIKAPNAQLNQLLEVAGSIVQTVDDFWAGHEVNHEKLILDPDSFLSLLIYVLIKAQYHHIFIQEQFMELFITEADKSSAKGYNLVTLSIAINWVLEQNPSDFSAVTPLSTIGGD